MNPCWESVQWWIAVVQLVWSGSPMVAPRGEVGRALPADEAEAARNRDRVEVVDPGALAGRERAGVRDVVGDPALGQRHRRDRTHPHALLEALQLDRVDRRRRAPGRDRDPLVLRARRPVGPAERREPLRALVGLDQDLRRALLALVIAAAGDAQGRRAQQQRAGEARRAANPRRSPGTPRRGPCPARRFGTAAESSSASLSLCSASSSRLLSSDESSEPGSCASPTSTVTLLAKTSSQPSAEANRWPPSLEPNSDSSS